MVHRYNQTAYMTNNIMSTVISNSLAFQINTRHHFLTRFVGTKGKEDKSYFNVNNDNLWITLTTCLCCILEIVLYLVYNRMVIFDNYNKSFISVLLGPSMAEDH